VKQIFLFPDRYRKREKCFETFISCQNLKHGLRKLVMFFSSIVWGVKRFAVSCDLDLIIYRRSIYPPTKIAFVSLFCWFVRKCEKTVRHIEKRHFIRKVVIGLYVYAFWRHQNVKIIPKLDFFSSLVGVENMKIGKKNNCIFHFQVI